jgi:hypothetical protein
MSDPVDSLEPDVPAAAVPGDRAGQAGAVTWLMISRAL